MRMLSNSFQNTINSVSTDKVILDLLHVVIHENDGSTTNWYYVNNKHEAIVSNGQTYEPATFKIGRGEDTKEGQITTTLVFDPLNREIIRKIREVNRRPEINYSLIVADNPDVVEVAPINLIVESSQIQDTGVQLTLTVEPILNEPIPKDTYTPRIAPGLWGNIVLSHIGEGPEPLPPESNLKFSGQTRFMATPPNGRTLVSLGLQVSSDGTVHARYTLVWGRGYNSTYLEPLGRWHNGTPDDSEFEASIVWYPNSHANYKPLTNNVWIQRDAVKLNPGSSWQASISVREISNPSNVITRTFYIGKGR